MTSQLMMVLPSLLRAGAENQVVDLANRIDPARYGVHLFTFEPQLDQLARIDASRVRHLHAVRRTRCDLTPVRRLAQAIDAEQIDVVHCTLQISLLVGWLASRLSRRRPRLVVAIHTTINRNAKAEWQDRLLYQWLMRQCEQIVFVCDAQRAYWEAKYPFIRKLAVTVHNGIDVGRFEPLAARQAGAELRRLHGIADDALVVAHIAAFRPEKAHALVLDALEQVLRQLPGLVLLCAGDGPLRAAVTEQARQRGLAAHIRFLGNLPDVRPVLGGADFALLPSVAVETFSLAMLESLALEVPMIASDLGGAREAVLDGETGLIVPPRDVAALVKAMLTLGQDAALRRRMGQRGRALVLERYSVDIMVAKTEAAIAASQV
ncbi:glycosyltransferase [Duganella sp. FT135W]|uniref:Glycosyltransferase n=1 Tax=Duganella flavida TaxID=2692175 RepID=A0A6L8KEL1_9BURK|nr:glycosyltransferase family 4 protein [Duganella flavida]MYM25899.1 glycosyltransferase [Duganella flavida]